MVFLSIPVFQSLKFFLLLFYISFFTYLLVYIGSILKEEKKTFNFSKNQAAALGFSLFLLYYFFFCLEFKSLPYMLYKNLSFIFIGLYIWWLLCLIVGCLACIYIRFELSYTKFFYLLVLAIILIAFNHMLINLTNSFVSGEVNFFTKSIQALLLAYFTFTLVLIGRVYFIFKDKLNLPIIHLVSFLIVFMLTYGLIIGVNYLTFKYETIKSVTLFFLFLTMHCIGNVLSVWIIFFLVSILKKNPKGVSYKVFLFLLFVLLSVFYQEGYLFTCFINLCLRV